MKKNIYYVILVSLILLACKKEEQFLYDSNDNIYLDYFDRDGVLDTAAVTYSFAYNPGIARDTVWVPVIIAGHRVSKDRRFVLTIVDTATTATKDLHYEPLATFYVMPADSGKINVPLVIKNIDPELSTKSVAITLRLTASEDFGEKLPLDHRTKKVIYSNRLEQPSWWMFWQGQLGPYSRVTHQLFLISGGQDLVNPTLPDAYMQIPRTLYYLENVRLFVKDPFTWVTRHPEAGYVLTKRNDGSEDYDFYSKESPAIKLLVKYFPQVDDYFFVNETGAQIIM